jgi:hypothetical protein
MKRYNYKILFSLLILLAGLYTSYSQTSPVTVSTLPGYPSSLYLPDYYSAGSNKLKANLMLNDFNEPSRNVYLRITIESQGIRISTKAEYIPTGPITLYPGVLMSLSGDDLEPYLNYNNIILEGIEYNTLISNGGKLPEGFYSICIEAIDYETHLQISSLGCTTINLAQNEPPKLIAPNEGEMIAPSASQNINFQWVNPAPVDPSNVYYLFTLYELIKPDADPKLAIANNQALVIHQEEVSTTMFNYNSSHPLLEVGKTYIYTVQAVTMDGKELFKNNGISEPSYFYFGYPGNGKIQLLDPENNSALELVQERIFSWSAPDNLLAGQSYYYDIKIAMTDSTRTYEEVLEDSVLVYSKATTVVNGKKNYFQKVNAYFESGKSFVWQVKAYTGEQEIAKSDIYTFGGPPCILDFIAADEYVQVTFTDGCDLSDLTGTGTVKLFPDMEPQPVYFNHVSIVRDGVQYYLKNGAVWGDLSEMESLKMAPKYERNGKVLFDPDSLKITRYDFNVKGRAVWDFPHAADQQEAPVISSKSSWLIYEDDKIFGDLPFEDSTGFDLLDPMNFRIDFTEGSKFTIFGNRTYSIDFYGNITLPTSVTTLDGDTVVFPFVEHNQVFNIKSDPEIDYQSVLVANKTELTLKPTGFTLDLDNNASGGYFSGSPEWRGLLIDKGQYAFNGDYKFSKQFVCDGPNVIDYDFNNVASEYAYVQYDGLYVFSDIDFGENNQLYFNTFPTKLNNFHIDVAHSYTNEGKVNGGISIPLLGDDLFPFTCNLNHFGFQPGFLDEDLEGKQFVYNKGSKENELLITFNKGYFADNERLENTITVEWPYLDITYSNLPMFRIWGNYDIGFGSPGGSYTLANQLQTRIKGFEITIDGIGAGRQGNAYAIGTTANIVMAEDASGEDGPTKINFYSIYESATIDENLIYTGAGEYENTDQSSNNAYVASETGVGQAVEGAATIGDMEAYMERLQQDMETAEAEAQALIPKKPIGKAEPSDNLKEDLASYIPTGDSSDILDSPVDALTYQDLIKLIDFIVPFLKEDQQAKIIEFKELLVTFSPEEIEAFLSKFSDIRGLLNNMIKGQIGSQVAKYTKPLKDKVDGLNSKIEAGIMNGTDSLVNVLEKGIDIPINGFVDLAINTVNASPIENKTPLLETINKVSTSVRKSLKTELRRSVEASVNKNIVVEATGIVDTILYTGTIMYLTESLAENAANLITNPDFTFADLDIDFDGMVENNVHMLESKITFDYFSDRISNTIDDIICGFDWDNVKDTILSDLIGGSVEAFIEDKITDAVTDAFGETAGGIVGGLAQNVSMDFSNLGQKLKDGDLSGIIKFDPSYIVIITPVADISGYVKFTNDDPIWGDSFQAKLNAKIKKPVKLNGFVQFINGSKPVVDVSGMTDEEKRNIETYKFWFIEAGLHGFFIPLTPVPVAMTGFEGKVYHHMVQQPNGDSYLPSDSVRFGIGARVFMADAASKGKIAAFDVGLELELVSGGFNITMDGNAYIANASVSFGGGTNDAGKEKKEMTLSRTLVLANGFMHYNSIEKHFLATMSVELNTSPLLCAGGSMVIDISKDWWRFAIGTREDPIKVSPLCKIDIFKGWFDINKTGLDVGLMTNIDIDVKSPWINIGIAKFRGWAYFYFDFEAELVIFWQPKFGVQKGRVYIDIGAGVGIDWKTFLKSGSFTIAAVNLGGELEFATIPEAYLKGEVHGSVTVLGIKAGMSMNAEINF